MWATTLLARRRGRSRVGALPDGPVDARAEADSGQSREIRGVTATRSVGGGGERKSPRRAIVDLGRQSGDDAASAVSWSEQPAAGGGRASSTDVRALNCCRFAPVMH